ncbi:MAG: hypothetical protein DI603_17990 [Roseateles depolymerans]|uniref:Uncharacterized protein n=1 Tax=Roseateles depolymerans TaxID=76731 RepID=A0A2W5DFA3_9BURK|nr:MAG: hypothetical protein DI603_17990 [Roseateles depolymerans]
MGKLLDRIKRELQNLARRPQPAQPPAEAPEEMPDRSRTPRLRSELDPPTPSEIERQMLLREQRATPPGTARQRKAQLAKARRPAPAANAPTLWGSPGRTATSLFGPERTGDEGDEPLMPIKLAGREAPSPAAPAAPTQHWLAGAAPLAEPAADRQEPPLFGPAAGWGQPPGDPPDRLF